MSCACAVLYPEKHQLIALRLAGSHSRVTSGMATALCMRLIAFA